MANYMIGLDFGTLSGRALLVDTRDGREAAESEFIYPHGVMDARLPSGKTLPPDFALQDPRDYLDVLSAAIPELLRKSGVPADRIVGVGIDFTACTLLPVKKDGTPLCFLEEYKDEPHAYVKLWKHHAAQDKANLLNEEARKRNEPWLARYGGKISSEWAIPKIWQILDEAPEIYEAADFFIEAADWIVWQLCGVQTRNACTAGYKAIWHKRHGYPDKAFFRALDPRLENLVEDKFNVPVSPLGAKAGEITDSAAKLMGLAPGAAVAVGNVDAHVCVPAVKIDGEGKMLAIMGTSTCHMLLGKAEKTVPGMCGVVEDGILPGYFGYEAGQSCVGDHFAWFMDNCLPASCQKEAEAKGMGLHAYLREKAKKLLPGESGLIALDWWNGNRSILADADLSGMMLGMTLKTKPEEMYRALIEATAYGTRRIIEAFEENGIQVDEFYAAGGISQKDEMTMQIYADVIKRPVFIAGSKQGPALGSAIFGAVAAGAAAGGYDRVSDAAQAMGKLQERVFFPDPDAAAVYDALYREYRLLHDYFGRGENDVMKRLKTLRQERLRHKTEE